MRIKRSEPRLTRVIIDGSHSVDLANLQLVMHRIHQELRRQVPLAPHRPIDSALLGLAAQRCILDADDSTQAVGAPGLDAARFEDN